MHVFEVFHDILPNNQIADNMRNEAVNKKS